MTSTAFSTKIRAVGIAAGLAFTLALPAAPALAAPIYSLEVWSGTHTDLIAAGLAPSYNSSGDTVGGEPVGGQIHAHYYSPSNPPQDLGTLPGHTMSWGVGISDNGKVTGYSELNYANRRAFLWDADENGGQLLDLGTLGGSFSVGYAVNDSGQVVGESELANTPQSHAFLWQDGVGMIDLGVLDDGTWSYALDINNAGQIVGTSYGGGAISRAVLWDEGDIFDLNVLLDDSGEGWTLLEANTINHDGWIIAWGLNALGQQFNVLLKPLSADDDNGTLIPEPGMVALFGLGLTGLGLRLRRRD